METLYKNAKELVFNAHKLCNTILCLSNFLDELYVENGLEWCEEL